jgi:hypothetical protein
MKTLLWRDQAASEREEIRFAKCTSLFYNKVFFLPNCVTGQDREKFANNASQLRTISG